MSPLPEAAQVAIEWDERYRVFIQGHVEMQVRISLTCRNAPPLGTRNGIDNQEEHKRHRHWVFAHWIITACEMSIIGMSPAS